MRGGAEGGAVEVPTLEVFRAAVDPDAFYSERELVALYVETYPPASSPVLDRKVARNRRLRDRQDAALARMEASLVEAPQLEHTLDGWFDARLVARLAAAGVDTFAQLLALMRARRQRWYRAVPRLGAIGAQRVSDFIAQHPDTLGYLSPLAVTPRRQLAAGHPALQPVPGALADVVPLEALRVPAALDGSAGLNRAPVPAHQAELNTGLQAVHAWIATRGARSEATRRAYRREAERLLLWAIVVKGKPLSSLNTMDCAEYLDGFLRDPQPAERWIGRGRVERFDPAWRPFVGPLSERSRDTARRILNAMGAWLVGQQYLRVNPFAGMPAAPSVPIDATGRTLTRAQWQYVLQTVLRPVSALDVAGEQAANGATIARDAFLLLFAYATGLRRAELAAATTGALTRSALDGALDDAWSLKVIGKGRRARTVPMPRRLIDALRAQLHAPGAADARDRAGRHAADRAPGDRRGTASGRGRAAVQGNFCAGRRPVGDDLPERGRGPAPREYALAAPHVCEPRPGLRCGHPRHAGAARPREPGHDDALHQGRRGAAVPVGRGIVQRGARRRDAIRSRDRTDGVDAGRGDRHRDRDACGAAGRRTRDAARRAEARRRAWAGTCARARRARGAGRRAAHADPRRRDRTTGTVRERRRV